MDGAQFFPQLPSESLKNDGKTDQRFRNSYFTFLREVMRKKKAFFCHSFLPVHTSAYLDSLYNIYNHIDDFYV